MDTKAYIASGILEAYLLGALPQSEQDEVMANVARYPELALELEDIENTMIRYAEVFAVNPPAALKEKIMNALPVAGGANAADDKPNLSRIIPLQPEYRKKTMDWKYAAMIAFLIGSVAINIILYNQGKDARTEHVAMSTQMQKLQADQKQLAAQVNEYQKARTMMADTGMQTIVMHTMLKGHPMAATLYWSKGKGDAYVAMNALPEPPKGMQYQLWVIQNGKPVSMGTLPNEMANTPGMQKVDMQVTAGDAFAISLEKEGGNPTPTTVYVLGKA